jgi:hypothetical protein
MVLVHDPTRPPDPYQTRTRPPLVLRDLTKPIPDPTRPLQDLHYCVVGSYRGLVKGVAKGDPPGITQERPFTPRNPAGFHPPDLRIR